MPCLLSINPAKEINARLMKPLPLTDVDFLLVGKLPRISFFSAQAAEVTNGAVPLICHIAKVGGAGGRFGDDHLHCVWNGFALRN